MGVLIRTLTSTVLAAGALTAVATGPADAVPAPGSPEGAVTFSAKNLGACKAEFTIVNKTNVTTYTIDWRIDDEPGRDIGVGFDVWRTGTPNMASKAALPSWPDGGAGENTVENRTMVSNREPVTATYVQDLKNIVAGWNPPLPNPDARSHRVDYRIVLGPPGNNGQTPDEKPEWLGDRAWRHITVTGCGATTGSSGSADNTFGSLGGGLFGMLR
ncbi:hypothetical protein SAMN04488550_2855 [Gordonia malaquae]|uniref:Uncharacterized protein n=1 Tax=Gordonia malaquae NBRC 108250 TaxID=1223542 RepID=M3UHB8_GORML|nr:hypothetical protein [Gordonia malaquae]GAC78730.1 hypothetical protein GM1_004_01750 [Gordonia malaquae NBRC 108250]SED62820.1 hypothetical protein SAMN04488550_2855 [Gordonia malaquae]